IQTIAGGSSDAFGGFGDGGPATRSTLRFPNAIAIDGNGALYIADTNNDRIRRVAAHGTILTVAGGGQAQAEGGDGTAALLLSPQGVAVDRQGRLYIADTDNNRIRAVENGKITTVAGGGSATGENVPATMARVDSPRGLALDADGNLYFAEFNRR